MLAAAVILAWLGVLAVLVAWHLDQRAHEAQVRDILDRISTSPRIEVRPAQPLPVVPDEPAYVSDLPYHDELWDDFTHANEAPPVPDEDPE